MIPEEAKVEIERIYNEAIEQLEKVALERDEIVKTYIKQLEQQKIELIRQQLADLAK